MNNIVENKSVFVEDKRILHMRIMIKNEAIDFEDYN